MTNLYARAVFLVEDTERRQWGQPTLVINDLDGNELFFWDWPDKNT